MAKSAMRCIMLAAVAALGHTAHASAYRCAGPDGKVMFQDRPCAPGDKTVQVPPTQASPAAAASSSLRPSSDGVLAGRVGPWNPTVQDRTAFPTLSEDALKAKVVAALKDGDSAKFEGTKLVWSGRALCGSVNGKNSYGAYAGFKEFVADNQGVYWSGDSSTAADPMRLESRNTFWSKARFWGCAP